MLKKKYLFGSDSGDEEEEYSKKDFKREKK